MSGRYGNFLCQMQECRMFKSNGSIQIKHVMSAFQPYEIHILVRYDGSNTSNCDIRSVQN